MQVNVIRSASAGDVLLWSRESVTKSTPKTGRRKPVPVSAVSDIQFGTEFFWYRSSAPISGMYVIAITS